MDHHDDGHDHDHSLDRDDDLVRRAAHVILDGLTANDWSDPDAERNADAMELAFGRLLEIEAVELTMDDEEGELELDMSPLMGGVMVLLRTLVTELAARDGVSPDDVVASLRGRVDGGVDGGVDGSVDGGVDGSR